MNIKACDSCKKKIARGDSSVSIFASKKDSFSKSFDFCWACISKIPKILKKESKIKSQ